MTDIILLVAIALLTTCGVAGWIVSIVRGKENKKLEKERGVFKADLRIGNELNNELRAEMDMLRPLSLNAMRENERFQAPFQGKGHRCEICGRFVSPLAAIAVLDNYAKWKFTFYHRRCLGKLT